MLDTITKNPVPAALVGLGMYWLLKSPSGESRRFYQEPYQPYVNQNDGRESGEELEARMIEGAQSVKEGYQSAKNQVQDRVADWKEQAGHQAQQWKEEAGHQAQQWKEQAENQVQQWKGQAGDKAQMWKEQTGHKIQEMKGYFFEQSQVAKNEFSSLMEKNPLAVGAVMLAIGAAVAAALPGSRKEDQWMGRSRDKMLNSVKTTVQSAVEDVTHQTEQAATQAFKREDNREI